MQLTLGVVFDTLDSKLATAARERLDGFIDQIDRDMNAAIGHKLSTYYRLKSDHHPARYGLTRYTITIETQPWAEMPVPVAAWLAAYRYVSGSAPMRPRFRGAVLLGGWA